LPDEEGFEENVSDRGSENELDDIEPDTDVDSDATDDYNPQIPQAADAGKDSRDPDSDGDGHVAADNSGSIPAFTSRVWDSIASNYTPNVDFEYR